MTERATRVGTLDESTRWKLQKGNRDNDGLLESSSEQQQVGNQLLVVVPAAVCINNNMVTARRESKKMQLLVINIVLSTLYYLCTVDYSSASIIHQHLAATSVVRCRKGVESPSIDSRCHHRLPACLPVFLPSSECNLFFFRPAALTAAFPDAASRPALRADTEMRKDQAHLPVMNPRPRLALSFAHRRRLLLLFRPLYHALVGLPNWPDCARVTHCPCQCPFRSNVRRGYRRRSSASPPSSPCALPSLHELQVPALLHLQATRTTRGQASFVLDNDIPCRSLAHSDSLPIASIPYSCATQPAPATCQPCALTQHEARGSHSPLCYSGLRAIGTALRLFSSPPTQSFRERQTEQCLVARNTSLIGSLAMLSRDLQLYSFLVSVPTHVVVDRCRRPRAVAR